MNNLVESEDENNSINPLPDAPDERERVLSQIVNEKENDESLKELSQKLSAEWKKPSTKSKKPDLSFAKFKEKLTKRRGQ